MLWRPLGVVLIAISLAGASACADGAQPSSTATPAPSPDGGRPAQLSATSQPATQPSPGGIVFAIGGSLWRVNTDGSGLRRIVGADNENRPVATAPEFAPDGRTLAYIEGHRYVVIAGDPGADRLAEIRRIELFDKFPLTPTGADNWDIGPFAVHWSPDGSLLLVTRQRTGGSGHTDVMLMKPDGTERRTFLRAEQLAPSFPEATWSANHAPAPQPPAIAVVSGADGTTGEAYDLQGNRLPAAYPAKTMRIAVAAHQNPAGEGVLVASSLGSPEPFGPIEIYDITGASRIVAGGCGAAWSPDGIWLSYYDGYGIALQRLDAASPDDHVYAAKDGDLGLDASARHAERCDGASIAWRRDPFPRSPG
jgi:hypothetical protein